MCKFNWSSHISTNQFPAILFSNVNWFPFSDGFRSIPLFNFKQKSNSTARLNRLFASLFKELCLCLCSREDIFVYRRCFFLTIRNVEQKNSLFHQPVVLWLAYFNILINTIIKITIVRSLKSLLQDNDNTLRRALPKA